MSKKLTREDIDQHVRIGKSIKCGSTWYTVEKFSKLKEGMLLCTSPWELQRGKTSEGKVVTFSDLLKNVNEGDWVLRINGDAIGFQGTNMKIEENILTNSSEDSFDYELRPIPANFSEKIRQIAKKLYDFFLDQKTDKLFDVGVGYVKPIELRGYLKKFRAYLRKREGEGIPDEAAKDGVVALQLGNGAGLVIVIVDDGSFFVDKFMHDGTSKGFDHFTSFGEAKQAINRMKANLVSWASAEEREDKIHRKVRSKLVKEDTPGSEDPDQGRDPQKDETEESAMSQISREMKDAILTEDVMRRRFRSFILDEMGAEDDKPGKSKKEVESDEDEDEDEDEEEDEEEKESLEVDAANLEEDEDEQDELDADAELAEAIPGDEVPESPAHGVLDRQQYEDNILKTPPRNLMFDQKAYLGENTDLMDEYEDIWGYVPVSGIPLTGSQPYSQKGHVEQDVE